MEGQVDAIQPELYGEATPLSIPPSRNEASLSINDGIEPTAETDRNANHQQPPATIAGLTNSFWVRSESIPATHDVGMDPNDEIIRLEGVSKTFLIGMDGVPALRNVSLRIYKRQFVVVCGLSGCGKSTLLSIMGTIDRHSKGDLYLFGNRILPSTSDTKLADLRLHEIGFIFQSFNLLPTLTVLANVEMPMLLTGKYTATERKRRALYLLERVGMSHRLERYPSQLSGGEQQRVTIARSLANHPRIILADEPSANLDTLNTFNILNYLLEIHEEEDVTIVMVTHDLGLRNYADRVIQMRDGKIISDVMVPEETRNIARRSLRDEQAKREREGRYGTGQGLHSPSEPSSGFLNSRLERETGMSSSSAPIQTIVRKPEDYGHSV